MKIKYPRTYHAQWSPGATSDDKIVKVEIFSPDDIIWITEKMDGENTSMTRDSVYARSLDSKHHESRSVVKSIWASIKHRIPINFRICGENMYAVHSIEYSDLESYFLVFSVWDGETCLNKNDTEHFCRDLGLTMVKTIYHGNYDPVLCKNLFEDMVKSGKEGIVVRTDSEFHISEFPNKVFKAVRKDHVKTDQHWMHSQIKKNGLI